MIVLCLVINGNSCFGARDVAILLIAPRDLTMDNIDMTGNVVHMATSTHNAPPWWEVEGIKEAIKVNPNDTPQQWREAALDWEISKAPVKFEGLPQASQHRFPYTVNDRFVIYRNDTMDALTTDASSRYNIHSIDQLCEAMKLVCNHGGYRMNTIGSLRGGKEIWFMANTDDNVNIAGEKFNRNVILGTSYDQTRKSFGFCSDVAVVCSNTLNYAIDNAESVFKFSHLRPYNALEVVGDLKKVEANQVVMQMTIEKLADTKITTTETESYFQEVAKLLPVPKKYAKEPAAFTKTIVDQMTASNKYAMGATLPNRVDTLHGATQAVVHFVDYKMLQTQTGESKANRFGRAFFGDGAKLKNKAMGIALDLAA